MKSIHSRRILIILLTEIHRVTKKPLRKEPTLRISSICTDIIRTKGACTAAFPNPRSNLDLIYHACDSPSSHGSGALPLSIFSYSSDEPVSVALKTKSTTFFVTTRTVSPPCPYGGPQVRCVPSKGRRAGSSARHFAAFHHGFFSWAGRRPASCRLRGVLCRDSAAMPKNGHGRASASSGV